MNKFIYQGKELDVFAQAIRWKCYFKHILKPYIGTRVAEVGAGKGATTAIMCDGNQELWLCLEPDDVLKQQIDQRIHAGQLPACCRTTNAFINEQDVTEQFDTILYIDVLEHIQNDLYELLMASEHLSLGGTLIVLSPAYQFLYSVFDSAIGHVRRYNNKKLMALTPPCCRIERTYFLDSVGLATSIANRIILQQQQPSIQQILFWDRFLVPISRYVDYITGYRFGRSILFIWRKVRNL